MSDEEYKIPTYHEMNRERFSARKKLWAQANKDKIKESNKKWRENNKEYLKQKQLEYSKGGYYKNKLLQRFNVLKGELLIGNDSQELLEELSNILDEMKKLDLIEEEEYNNLKNYFKYISLYIY